MKEITTPPIGLVPKWLWIEQRKKEILKAINRYKEAGYEIPQEWLTELREHEKSIANKLKAKNYK